jgi:hypothetical protein
LLLAETERLVGRQATAVHCTQHRYADIGVVVDPHARLAALSTHETTCVLDEAALEGDGEGEEERVELRAIEPFAELLAGRDNDERLVGRGPLDLVHERLAGTFAKATFEHERRDSSLAEPFGERPAVLFPLAEDEAPPAFSDRGAEVLDLAHGFLEPVLNVAFGHGWASRQL